jgi:Xaa-Pro aminopeptidase
MRASLKARPLHDVSAIQPLLTEAGLDAAVVMSPRNLFCLTGYPRAMGQRPGYRRSGAAIAFPADPPLLITGRFQEEIALIRGWARSVTTFSDYLESPLARAAEVLRERGLQDGRIGVEARWIPAEFYDDLLRGLDGAEVVPCDDLLDTAWAAKTAPEVERLDAALKKLSEAVAGGLADAAPSDTEDQIHQRILAHIRNSGTQTGYGRLTSGASVSVPHALPSQDRIEPGALVRIDYGCTFGPYAAHVARTGVLGEPSGAQQASYQRYHDTLQSAIAALGPGLPGRGVFQAIQRTFADAGLELRGTSVGHAVGIGFYERPRVHAHEDFETRPGCVLCIEPEADNGTLLSQTVEITADGFRPLASSDSTSEVISIAVR